MKREFSFITIGQILDELHDKGLRLSRSTLLRRVREMDQDGDISIKQRKNSGGHIWRIFTSVDKNRVVNEILEYYGKV